MKKTDILKKQTERSDGWIGVSVSEVLSESPPDILTTFDVSRALSHNRKSSHNNPCSISFLVRI